MGENECIAMFELSIFHMESYIRAQKLFLVDVIHSIFG
ncbi:hypothetical protein KIS4809_4864 [Bacillus sp. ZZV12-4809]|nr:hypothetical protein KIS4809_4864 [Bacillus sp. ZZV12-4809]